MIRYVGNPYVDAGLAVLELRLKKPCTAFSENDLGEQARQLEAEYNRPIWKSYLTVHFPNSAWVQPRISQEKKRSYVDKVLASYRLKPLVPARGCVFCSKPAQTVVDRSHFPLLTGETVMVAGAGAEPGLLVCGFCIFAVQFYPLAALKVAEVTPASRRAQPPRPLFWWAPEPGWTRLLTRRFLKDVDRVLAASSDHFANLRWPSTQLLRAARGAMDDLDNPPEWLAQQERPPLCDIVGIHATNYGSGPDYDELRIPRNVLEFWSEARSSFGALYQRIEDESWETREKTRKGKRPQDDASLIPELARRNRLYEALGAAFRSSDPSLDAKRVASTFFLRRRTTVEPNTIALAEFFLEKVANMERQRLDAIREIADAIVESKDLRWILDKLMRSGKGLYDYLPTLRAVQQRLSAEHKPIAWQKVLIALDLVSDEDATARDTWLVSELVLIRILERLGETRSELLAEVSVTEEAPQPEPAN